MKNKLTKQITRLTAKHIRGTICVYQVDRTFYIEIIDNKNYVWRHTIEDFNIKFSLMNKAKIISDTIVITYRKYINSCYFY